MENRQFKALRIGLMIFGVLVLVGATMLCDDPPGIGYVMSLIQKA